MPCCVASRHRLTVIWTKTIVMQGPGTGGRLCSPNLRFWRPALSIELHPYIYRPQRRYATGWVRLSGGLFVVLTKALRPRLHRRCFVLPGRLLLFTACFAAWRVRPSGPDRGLVRPAAYMPPARSGCPVPGEEKGGDARYSYRLGSGRRVMGRRWFGHNCPYLIICHLSINVNDKFLLLL